MTASNAARSSVMGAATDVASSAEPNPQRDGESGGYKSSLVEHQFDVDGKVSRS